jgi:NAD(P)-dependent dehydrogenase (short-subunit alcohol dehydrogenase family)
LSHGATSSGRQGCCGHRINQRHRSGHRPGLRRRGRPRRRERTACGEEVAAAIRGAGGQAVFQQTDVRQPDDCRRLCRRAEEEFGGLDILVNNAAIFPRATLDETTVEFWSAMFEINVRGAFLCSQAAVPLMRARGGGAIIYIGSGHACICWERLFAYGCSKGALYAMTMHMARALAPDRIRVNWITVGWVLTEKELDIQLGDGHDAEWLKAHRAHLPMGQYNTVDDIAAACVYLASDDAQRLTAADLNLAAALCIRV